MSSTDGEPDTGFLDIRGLLSDDPGFSQTVKLLGNVPMCSEECFNRTDLLFVHRPRILVILRSFPKVFEEVVGLPAEERVDFITSHTIALRFNSGIRSVKGHGFRFAVMTDLLNFDSTSHFHIAGQGNHPSV
ncbi:hypothetical protein Q8F55_001669 [Vanrija albida]|uniref:Uncharacterized protein n=1 Tax=Vanrija albida TaxID=181172 RepID=A0ABR3Q7U6_9TREE